MRKFLVIFSSFMIFVFVILGAFYFHFNEDYEKMIDSERFPDNSTLIINDWEMNVSNQTAESVFKQFSNTFNTNKNFKVTLGDEELLIDLSKYYKNSLTVEDFKDLVRGIGFSDYLLNKKFKFELKNSLDCDKENVYSAFEEFVKNLNYKYEKAVNAYFDFNTYSVVKEINGTELNKEVVLDGLKNAFNKNEDYLDLNNNIFYLTAEITSTDIEKQYKDLIDIYNWKALYSISDYVIEMKDYMDYVTKNEDGTYSIDTSFMTKAVLNLSKTIDEKGIARTFKSTLDGVITVSGGTYGQIMNNKEEISYLIEKLNKRESVIDRIPIWKVEPKEEGYENTYIEIDLSAQHVWYYVNNELIMESDCVTGTDNTSRETPTGYYFVSEKVNGKYLTGADYKTWVDKWMRITDRGHGLHDASWRKSSEFGGNTYKTDGSHGCINLPKKFAYNLYDKIDVGVLVVIHE